jgi:tetratricopeptide (TPR) repeat protein
MPVGTVLAVHERRLIYAAVYRYLTNIAGPAGTVLILDDLQWSSPDGLDLLASVIQRTDGTAVRVIGAYRSTTVRQDHPLSTLLADLAEQCLVDQLDLDPLGDEDAMRLLDALLQSSEHADDHAVKQRIVQRAGGVPFFLLSYVHAIEERGRWPSVPWTAAQSIRQRLAALPPAAQEIVRAAAILGRVSRRSTLLEMVESAEAGTGLDAAAQARLLLPHGNSTYQFAHDVVRESVEADLGEAHRVLLHRKAAQILEKLPEPERIKRSAELAWHFQEGDEPLRALPYSIQAGDESAAVSAHAEAQRHYRTALEALRRLGLDDVSARRMEAAVLEKLSALLAVTPNADETRDLLHRAAGIYRALGDPENEGRIIAQMGRAYYWGVGTTPERKRAGITFLQAAMESLGEDAPARTRAALSAVQSHLLFSLGMYRECLDAARAASELARCGDDDGVLAEVEVTRGAAFIKLGQEEEGFNATREALHLAEKAGDQFSEVRALYGLAALSFRRGCFSECRVHGPRALEVAERTGHTWAAHALLRNLGVLEFVTGDWPRARRFYERAIDLMRSFDESWRGATALPPLAWLELSAGNGPAVFHYLEESRLRAERTGSQADSVLAGWVLAEADLLTGDPSLAVTRLEPLYDTLRGEESSVTFLAPFPVPLLPTLAEAHLMAGNEERAEELVDASIRRCRARGHRPELVEALRVRGSLLARRRLWLEAERAFAEGLSPVRAMACPYAEARLLGAEGQMGLERGELELGRVQLQKALALFRRLGARPDAERIEHLLASPLGLA